ncbi:MAG: hypothetical protein HY701_14265 [Gemmatimonadetes bacterium]|nr:hypothetical protein [Gemmatimonadota bacterium]
MGLLAAAVALTVISVAFLLYPILEGRTAPLSDDEDDLSEQELRKRTALLALRDAEYDHLSGKLDEKDYLALRSQLAAEALDLMGPEEGEAVGARPALESDAIEREVTSVRAALRAGVVCGRCACANEPGSRFCMGCGMKLAARRCGECGQELGAASQFCSACGAKVS